MKTTIEMAREAWAEAGEGWVADAWFDDRAKAFEAFAAMVRADERERIAKWYESEGYMMFPVAIPGAIRSNT